MSGVNHLTPEQESQEYIAERDKLAAEYDRHTLPSNTLTCTCAGVTPTMPAFRDHHLAWCPCWLVECGAVVVDEVKDPVTRTLAEASAALDPCRDLRAERDRLQAALEQIAAGKVRDGGVADPQAVAIEALSGASPPLCAVCDHIEALHIQAGSSHAFVAKRGADETTDAQ